MEPGQRIEHYELTEKIGEGGMGVVWKATDSKLDREVAIKLLPAAFAEDPERLGRFRREAKLLAALNHNNIAQIYGVAEEGDCHAIVMELIEGDSLDAIIARGPLAEAEARRIGLQVAEALEAAHDKGIVHRDLKPANIKLTPQGEVKVLDFGLAKTLQDEVAEQDLQHSPTLTAMSTRAGVIMGTAHYMSPEQARGKPVDRRADVWAFGCVLYEMLAGHGPFRGSDVSEIVAHVITQEPDFAPLPGGLPGQVDELIRRCLRKDPKMRLSDMGTARVALLEAAESPRTAKASAASAGSGSRYLLALGLVAGLLLGATATRFMVRSSAPRATGPTHLDLVLDPPPTHGHMAFSSDGKTLIYTGTGSNGQRMLHVRRLDGFDSSEIPGTESGIAPCFSPDGEQISFFASGRLKRVSLLGGLPEVIGPVPGAVRGAFWSDDDEIIYSTSSTVIPYRMSISGGEPKPIEVNDLDPGARLDAPRPIPGTRFLLATLTSPELDGPRIAVLNRDTGNLRTVVRGLDAKLLPSGDLLFVQQGRLVVVPFDRDKGETTAPERAVPLEQPLIDTRTAGGRFHVDVSADGTLVYPLGTRQDETRLFHLGRDGSMEPTELLGEIANTQPSGSKIVYLSGTDVLVYDPADGVSTQILFTDAWYPRWSADGERVIFSERTQEQRAIRDVSIDGGDARTLMSMGAKSSAIPTSVARDGTIMGYYIHPQTSRDIFTVAPDGTKTMVLETRHNERAGAISPDGKIFAYVSDEEGGDDIFIRELPDSGRKWRVSEGGGSAPVWSRDGKELFYRHGNRIMVAAISGTSNVRVGPEEELLASDRIWFDRFGNPTFGLAADGGLLVPMTEESDVHVRIVQNWTPE